MQSAALLVLLLLATPGSVEPGPAITDAFQVETPLGSVYVSQQTPPGHYAEHYRGESYWLPGINEGTSLVRQVIRAAKQSRADAEALEISSYRVKSRRVFVTPEPPFPGVFWLRAGKRHAWLAGVEKPLKADMAALQATAARVAAAEPRKVAAAEPRKVAAAEPRKVASASR